MKKLGRPRDQDLASRRREEILEAATKLFARHGYQGTDVQIVADMLEVGKGTIYRYFPSKEKLFLASVDRGMRLLSERIDEKVTDLGDPLKQFVRAVQAYLEFFETHPDLVELLIQERAAFRDRKKPTYFEHRDANIDRWKGILEQFIDSRRAREIPVNRILDVVTDLLYGTIFTNYFARPARSLEAQASDLLDIVLNGILADKNDRGDTRRHDPEEAP